MTPEQFVYWLQGYLEAGNPQTIEAEPLTVIKEHIGKVLTYRPPVTFIPGPSISYPPLSNIPNTYC